MLTSLSQYSWAGVSEKTEVHVHSSQLPHGHGRVPAKLHITAMRANAVASKLGSLGTLTGV